MATGAREEQIWNWILDRILPLLTISVLVGSCVLGSGRKEIWIDEVHTLILITDPSLSHMMRGLANAVDGGMPLYYPLAHGWGLLFGTSLLSLRLFSSFFVCAGVLLLWNTLRNVYSAAAVSLTIVATTVTSAAVLHQNVEARYYGLYFACATLVFAAHQRLIPQATTRRLIILAVLANALLIMSHPFGVLYSAMAVSALGFTDYRRGRCRWSLYLTLAASWLLLLTWIDPILKVHDLAVPHNWTPIPTLTQVLSLFAFASPGLVFGLMMAAGLIALAPKAKDKAETDLDDSVPILYHAFAFLLPPLPIALISWGSSSLFVDRYFLPSLIGVATLTAYLLNAKLTAIRINLPIGIAWCSLLAIMLAWPLVSLEKDVDTRFETIDRNITLELPVIVADPKVFLPLSYLTRKAGRPYYYPLDWDASLNSPDPGATLEYKLMRNAKASGYYAGRIVDSSQALCLSPSFLVLNNPEFAWFQDRVFSSPDFQIEHVADFAVDRQLWLVKRLANGSSCRAQ